MKIAYVGVDYHLNSVSLAVMIEGQKEVHETIRIKNEDKLAREYKRLIDDPI